MFRYRDRATVSVQHSRAFTGRSGGPFVKDGAGHRDCASAYPGTDQRFPPLAVPSVAKNSRANYFALDHGYFHAEHRTAAGSGQNEEI